MLPFLISFPLMKKGSRVVRIFDVTVEKLF